MTLPDALLTVWTPAGALVAVIAGLVLGFGVLGYLGTLPTYATEASPAETARIIALGSSFAGAVFYIGQAIVATGQEDVPERLLSRYGLWVVYSIAMAIGTWLRTHLELRRRARRLAAMAQREVAIEETEIVVHVDPPTPTGV